MSIEKPGMVAQLKIMNKLCSFAGLRENKYNLKRALPQLPA